MKNILIVAVVIVVVAGGFVLFRSEPAEAPKIENNSEVKINQISEKMSEENSKEAIGVKWSVGQPVAKFETNLGTFAVSFYYGDAPNTVDNFVKLARSGFYDGLSFHRVIDGFMIQGGDPNCGSASARPGTPAGPCGTGGPGYTIPDEISPLHGHDKAGILSMANAGPNTGGSQFFITLAPTSWLDGKHAVFGEVTGGLEVIEKIGKTKVGANDRPQETVIIQKVQIQEIPFAN